MRRKLTVSSLRREWSAMHRLHTAYVPAIRLNGNWLEQTGFKTGDQVAVYAQNGSIAIVKEARPSC